MSLTVSDLRDFLAHLPSDMPADILTHQGIVDLTDAELDTLATRSSNFSTLPGVEFRGLLLLLPEGM